MNLMRDFNYYHPTRIVFGRDRINEVGKILKDAGEKVDICFDENQILFNLLIFYIGINYFR